MDQHRHGQDIKGVNERHGAPTEFVARENVAPSPLGEYHGVVGKTAVIRELVGKAFNNDADVWSTVQRASERVGVPGGDGQRLES